MQWSSRIPEEPAKRNIALVTGRWWCLTVGVLTVPVAPGAVPALLGSDQHHVALEKSHRNSLQFQSSVVRPHRTPCPPLPMGRHHHPAMRQDADAPPGVGERRPEGLRTWAGNWKAPYLLCPAEPGT